MEICILVDLGSSNLLEILLVSLNYVCILLVDFNK